jgi:surface antigen
MEAAGAVTQQVGEVAEVGGGGQGAPSAGAVAEENDENEVVVLDLLVIMQVNVAACLLKLEDHEAAVEACDVALQHAPHHAKVPSVSPFGGGLRGVGSENRD